MNSLVCLSLLALVAGACAQGFRAPGRAGGVPNNAASSPRASGGANARTNMPPSSAPAVGSTNSQTPAASPVPDVPAGLPAGRAIPGAGDMMAMAGGGMEAMVKMMLKMVDMSAVNKIIQQAAEILKITLRSGLKLLDAKMYDIFGIKNFSQEAEALAKEAEMPQVLIASVMAFAAIASQALLFVS